MDQVAAGSQAVFFGSGALADAERIHESASFLLVDANTAIHCLPVLLRKVPELGNAVVITVPAGEQCKSVEHLSHVWQSLLNNGADRRSQLFVCGGGAVCDLGGFAAATFHRGISCQLIPTSLLAMVDAAVGGKTAINLGHAKNQVGVFALPEAVYIDPDFLQTLPARELRSGMAEVLKHACLSDSIDLPNGDPFKRTGDEWTRIIAASVAYKQSVVAMDPEDRGVRQLLNFGHTLGHAIEAASHASGSEPLLHGEAVALGMIGELELSRRYCGLPEDQAAKLVDAVSELFVDIPCEVSLADLIPYLALDKKRSNGKVKFTLLKRKGEGQIGVTVDLDILGESLNFIYRTLESKRAKV